MKIILLARCKGLGDTIACTPTVREFRRLYPDADITILSFYPDLFKYNPNVDGVVNAHEPCTPEFLATFDHVIDLFQTDKICHATAPTVDLVSLTALKKTLLPHQKSYEVVVGKEHIFEANAYMKSWFSKDDKIILTSFGKPGWVTRDWMNKNRRSLDFEFGSDYIFWNTSRLSLLASIAFMHFEQVKCLITDDTGTLHLGACVPELPIVGVFTNIKAHYRTPYRNGAYGYKFVGINSDDPCSCTTDFKMLTDGSVSFETCPKKLDPMPCFPSVSKVKQAVRELLKIPKEE